MNIEKTEKPSPKTFGEATGITINPQPVVPKPQVNRTLGSIVNNEPDEQSAWDPGVTVEDEPDVEIVEAGPAVAEEDDWESDKEGFNFSSLNRKQRKQLLKRFGIKKPPEDRTYADPKAELRKRRNSRKKMRGK